MIRISDPALARRAKRQLLGLASYLMFLLPLAYAVHNGWMRFGYHGLGVFVLVAVLLNLGFLAAIGSGFSRRFNDPGLVTAQVVAAVTRSSVDRLGLTVGGRVSVYVKATELTLGP